MMTKPAETMDSTVTLRSVPGREIKKKVDFYLATINRDMSPADIADFFTRTKSLDIVKDVTREKGQALAKAINCFGTSAYSLQCLGCSTRH
jgi:hypothetical protein